METASQTERDGKEQGGNNATVVDGKFPLSSRDNFIAARLVPITVAGAPRDTNVRRPLLGGKVGA